jgi:hypothetical protein
VTRLESKKTILTIVLGEMLRLFFSEYLELGLISVLACSGLFFTEYLELGLSSAFVFTGEFFSE